MTKTLIKNTFREIKNSKARFISILAIIALGVGFFAGIKATSPSMINMADTYYKDSNLMDFRLVSTVGFEEDDIEEVKKTDGVTDVMPSYFTDVMIDFGGTANAVRLISIPQKYGDNKLLNEITLEDGRLPEKSGEILVEKGNFSGETAKIGSKIKISPKAGDSDVTEILDILEYTVVGVVSSPLYISYERGSTTIGNGKLSAFMYVLPDDFKVERYTELYVKTKYSDGSISAFSSEYEKGIADIQKDIESVASHRASVFNTDVIGKAQKEIDDGWATFNKEKDSTNSKLKSSKEELEKAQKEYNDGIASAQLLLSDAESQIINGEAELNSSLAEYITKIEDGEAELISSEEQLKKAREEYNKAKAEFDTAINSAQEQIDNAFYVYSLAYNVYYDKVKPFALYEIQQIEEKLTGINADIAKLEEELANAETASPDTSTADEAENIAKLKLQLESLYIQRDALEKAIEQGNYVLTVAEGLIDYVRVEIELLQSQLNAEKMAGELQLADALAQITKGEEQLTQGREIFEKAKAEGTLKLAQAQKDLEKAKAELEKAKAEFESQKLSGKSQLDDGWKKYREGVITAEKELKKAQEKLEDAQKELDKISEAKWYVFDRADNPGYSDFEQNTSRVDAVANVFPMFFLLVAVLVCLTTMTRLIEDKRTEIGTFKALGYSNMAIVSKFLIYATIASVIGCIVGLIFGISVLPFVIYDAYKMMYAMPPLTLVIDWFSVVFGIIAALLCTTTVAYVICRKSLKRKPATLMRPKAPKAGKRILLEYITPLWNRLSFTSKVTTRNLLRYKSRLFMTVLGIAGCTALIVAAYGLLDSFKPMTEKQFNDIYRYQAVIVPDVAGNADDLRDFTNIINADDNIADSLLVNQTAISVEKNDVVQNKSTNIVVPENLETFEDLVSLRTRVGNEPLPLTDDGVVITEKMATELGVDKGDTVFVEYDGDKAELKVLGITENYIYNYVYMSPQLFEKTFDNDLEFNCAFTKLAENAEENVVGEYYLEQDNVIAVIFLSSGVQEFNNMLDSMNTIVIVLIIFAGALAFVVLYNLTNINMEERIREIATIKVLGFYNKETAEYIYRENIILTILGAITGLVLGTILTRFVIVTVEVNNVMFGREIYFTTFLYATLFTFLFSALVNVFMYFKMKKIDMVESLKSIE